jgi:hypothetical protein
LSALALLAAAPSAFAQAQNGAATTTTAGVSQNLGQALGGASLPLTLQLKDLNGDWRRVNVTGQLDLGGYSQLLSTALSTFLGKMASAVYYTKGDVVTIGSETYIVAYRAPMRPIDFGALVGEVKKAGPQTKPEKILNEALATEKLSADTPLALSLLNLRTSGSLTDIRAFDLQREIDDSGKGLIDAVLQAVGEEEVTDPSLRNLKKLGEALTMYSADYDETLPEMTSAEAVKKALAPYVKDETAFAHPETKETYLPNPALSKKPVGHVEEYGEWMVAFYEAAPAKDGTRGIVTIDGTVKRVAEKDWEGLKKASKIP